jgi:hypothetical protein
MTEFCLLAEQSPENKWLEDHPQVLGAIILGIATLNLLFALALLLPAFIITRRIRNVPPLFQVVLYAPGVIYCGLVLVMLLFAAYLFCGGSPSFR